MKYVKRSATGAWDLTDYERYLENEKRQLSDVVGGDNLLDISRFSGGEFRGSLHDSRFRGFAVEVDEHQGGVVVEIRLEGPFFDRDFILRYQSARTATFNMPAPDRDLLMHEVLRHDEGVLHEILFDGGHVVTVVSSSMTFRELTR